MIICAHNPRPDYIWRVVDALRAQTMHVSGWELILIDNQSSPALTASSIDLSWHPSSQIIVEPTLGLTEARIRGIKSAKGDLLVFVDDDNVLNPAYLDNAASISMSFPHLGSWGAGRIIPEFETPLSNKFLPYKHFLALRNEDGDNWSNNPKSWPSIPLGAGLCVRQYIANRYVDNILHDNSRRTLDRRGKSLMGAGDIDLALTSRVFGLGWGTFDNLTLLHLMPTFRTKEDYLLRLVEDATASINIFWRRHGLDTDAPLGPIELGRRILTAFRKNGLSGVRFLFAAQRGRRRGSQPSP